MKIKALEEKSGLDRASIRFYEKEGLLNPQRLENGYREYSSQELELLMKIKLLRSLGVSLETIRQLQDGEAELYQVLNRQIGLLSSAVNSAQVMQNVCVQIQKDGAQYENMDSEKYLHMLREPAGEKAPEEKREYVEQEIRQIPVHPWRRWFARSLDYMLITAVVEFVMIVLLRIRPLPTDLMSAVILVLTAAGWVPIEALLLHCLGTTPGKWAMGIRVEDPEGGKLTLTEAFSRSWRVFTRGVGLRILLVGDIAMIVSYFRLTGKRLAIFNGGYNYDSPQEMSWDDASELRYEEDYGRKARVAVAGFLVIWAVLFGFTVSDGAKPTHRGERLTVAQFAENYNDLYPMIIGGDVWQNMLLPDGTRRPETDRGVVIYIGGEPSNPRDELKYHLENGQITGITLENSWNNPGYIGVMNYNVPMVIGTLVLSQKDLGLKDYENILHKVQEGIKEPEGSVRYGNLVFSWKLTFREGHYDNGYYYSMESEEPVHLWLNWSYTE